MGPSNNSESEDDEGPRRVAAERDPRPEAALLINRQRVVRGNWRGVQAFLRELSSRVAKSSFSVCLLSDRGIRRYNKQFRSCDRATDVLSFPAEVGGTKTDSYLGDILISVETARENAVRYGLGIEEEIKILALHGVLHLAGYDHERDGGQMARQERLWCARLGLRRGLIDTAKREARSQKSAARRKPWKARLGAVVASVG